MLAAPGGGRIFLCHRRPRRPAVKDFALVWDGWLSRRSLLWCALGNVPHCISGAAAARTCCPAQHLCAYLVLRLAS